MEDRKNIKSLPEKYKVVADIIRVGKENATLLSDIMMIADIDDRRHNNLLGNYNKLGA